MEFEDYQKCQKSAKTDTVDWEDCEGCIFSPFLMDFFSLDKASTSLKNMFRKAQETGVTLESWF